MKKTVMIFGMIVTLLILKTSYSFADSVYNGTLNPGNPNGPAQPIMFTPVPPPMQPFQAPSFQTPNFQPPNFNTNQSYAEASSIYNNSVNMLPPPPPSDCNCDTGPQGITQPPTITIPDPCCIPGPMTPPVVCCQGGGGGGSSAGSVSGVIYGDVYNTVIGQVGGDVVTQVPTVGGGGGGGGGPFSPSGFVIPGGSYGGGTPGQVLGASTGPSNQPFYGTGGGEFPTMPNTGLGDDKNVFYVLLALLAIIFESSLFFFRKVQAVKVNKNA